MLLSALRVILFGGTGMLGRGVLLECLADAGVEAVLSVGRSLTGIQDPKLTEIRVPDLFALAELGERLNGFDACFYCLGLTSVGMTEADYRRLTVDLTLSIAEAVLRQSPGIRFLFISGGHTDSTGTSPQMWARVKGEAENALLRMPFEAAYMFRPRFVQPLHGVLPQYFWARALYKIAGPLFPVWNALFPKQVSTTAELGRAMISVARRGFGRPILESWDFRKAV